ncbi:hypothetical protein [Nonomuraea sp. NPDC049646]|uniref:hypothetical protein n=1 Tax=unclassified Nonomuraea TaxID=2593643 RepID=UPI00379A96D0
MTEEELETAIQASLGQFRQALKQHPDPLRVVREFITHGPCVAITRDKHAELREAVAAELQVHPNRDVYTVGSAKLGFSIKPDHRYRVFGDTSDVDVAVVSPDLYNQLWREARKFQAAKGLWPRDQLKSFKNGHLRGSIHPGSIPISEALPTANSLWELGRELQRQQAAGPYKVTFVVWNDMDALESYQSVAVSACQGSERL